jgi:hypothetical protein
MPALLGSLKFDRWLTICRARKIIFMKNIAHKFKRSEPLGPYLDSEIL